MRILIAALCVLCLAPATVSAGSIVVGDFMGVNVGYYSPVTDGESRAIALGSVPMSGGSGISDAIDGLSFERLLHRHPWTNLRSWHSAAASHVRRDGRLDERYNVYRTDGAALFAGSDVAWLYNEYASVIATAGDNLARTGLQMAIWNTLYDSDFTVDTGGFRVSAQDTAVRAAANGYLTALSLNLTAATTADATGSSCGTVRSRPAGTCRTSSGRGAPRRPFPSPGRSR